MLIGFFKQKQTAEERKWLFVVQQTFVREVREERVTNP